MDKQNVLLIAEKPSLMRDIKSAYESLLTKEKKYNITYTALVGHILSLQSPEDYTPKWGKPWSVSELPMIPEQFKYEVKEKQIYNSIKKELLDKNYDFVINACDAGREGELIFSSVYEQSKSKLPVKRLWITSTTNEAIIKGMNNLIDGKEMENLNHAAKLRSQADWLTGMNFSRAITISSGELIAVGRVMTPTLYMIYKRWDDVENFKPKDFYEIEGVFKSGTQFNGNWINVNTQETRFDKKQKAQDIINAINKEKKGTVGVVKKKQEKKYAPPLHSLLELQREASMSLGITADETLKIAQKLYEGKLITYPRTESQHLPENFNKEMSKTLNSIGKQPEYTKFVQSISDNTIKEVCKNKKYSNNKKLTDHHAIIPTPVSDLSKLNQKEKDVYNLVAKRTLSIFLDPYIIDKTLITVRIKEEVFKCLGNIEKDVGYKILYKNNKSNKKDTLLPNLEKGDEVEVKSINLLSKKTSPPELFDDASLLEAMKNAGKLIDDEKMKEIMKGSGLGTAATRAAIIEKLLKRKMTKRKGKKIIPTDFGVKIIKKLQLFNANITSPELTASWEEKLGKIEDGQLSATKFYKELVEYIKENTTLFLDGAGKKLSVKCPNCNSSFCITPKSFQCTNNNCKLTIWKEMLGAEITKEDVTSIVKGKEVVKELTKKDKTTFHGKLYYDKENNKIGISSSGNYEEVGKCPACQKKILEKNKFYTCEDYPDKCKFLVSKVICGGKIEKEDLKEMLKGNESEVKQCTFKSGKTGKVKFKFKKDNSIEFIFEKK